MNFRDEVQWFYTSGSFKPAKKYQPLKALCCVVFNSRSTEHCWQRKHK